MVPRFEGPQSDKDTQSYKEAAGQLANPNLPTKIRQEAGKEILRLMKERKNQFEERLLTQEEKTLIEKNSIETEKQKIETLKLEILNQEKNIKKQHDENQLDYENKLLELANTTHEDAKKYLFEQLNIKYSKEINNLLRNHLDELELEKTNTARKILLETMENIVVDTANENTVKQIKIPNDDIKGKLIGRAGRNIRSLENLLGVNVIIDDTPCIISISSFNPVRRAMALLTIDSLINSGKINQVSIEVEVEKAVKKIEEEILEKGKDAIYRLNVVNMNIELIKILGKLYYRSSYGQNVLEHSIECAYIATKLANELGLDPNIAARCALLHDIGKIDSLETGKSHVVKACSNGVEKTIRFGQRGVKGSPKKEGESEEYKNRRDRFKARHSKNIKKGKLDFT
jgi:ribonuclease Y